MQTRRLIVIIVILIALAALVCVGGGQLAANLFEGSQEPPATSEAGRGAARLRAQGRVVPAHWVELGFPGGGVLAEMPVVAGQTVEAGDVLARLDTTHLALAVRAAEDAVVAQEAAVARLQEPPDAAAVAAATVSGSVTSFLLVLFV